jgi:hypothetical protein
MESEVHMPESRKVAEYRKTLDAAAKAGRKVGAPGQALLEGKAAKLGLEIQGEESKAAPKQTGIAKKGE